MRDLLEKERLSCQIYCEEDMKVRVSMTASGTGARDPGHPPERKITPLPSGWRDRTSGQVGVFKAWWLRA